ncbi:uncharacterized protein PHALS_15094 [Plasmopara halstedii]|uniref:Uncharacterized protein n=1 Tax=Plasmopara halstedii TaxID=4781 RepID=A0A0P1B2H0_PLAHL|nr:uncharacterized protein PHALS_15094 [Plasmopara halstedii]CEG48008.1 hypothetical protein PHALS_15094 [Plasmopara halstedii]|eukprot:XP_024584377.1 hypothetical protein PHALS_15094 [Plasmopara halstedii]
MNSPTLRCSLSACVKFQALQCKALVETQYGFESDASGPIAVASSPARRSTKSVPSVVLCT